MNLAHIIRLDLSDLEIYDPCAEAGEWAIPGSFAFSNWTEDDLTGQARQEFAHGFLGLTSFGRATVASVTPITEAERAALLETLSQHFVDHFGAPDLDTARPVAAEEIEHMAALCTEHPENTLIVLTRELSDQGIKERFRLIPPQGAKLDVFAVHGD